MPSLLSNTIAHNRDVPFFYVRKKLYISKTGKYIMDKNSKKWDKIRNIEVVNPFNITPLLRMNPITPNEYKGNRFDVFLDDEIGTEKITFRSASNLIIMESKERCSVCSIKVATIKDLCVSCNRIQEYWRKEAIRKGMTIEEYLIQSTKW